MSAEPGHDCPLCPRLVAFRDTQRARHPGWHNGPVRSFGAADARLLIVGLAPGLQGANRTGRPFTGDWAGDLLYETLLGAGLARGVYGESADDGLELVGARITNAVRCVPPQNKPTHLEVTACRPFLLATLAEMAELRAVLALGRIAHETMLRTWSLRLADLPFAHGAEHRIGGITLFDSYHCSRYNTNTRRLTPEMFRAVFARVRETLGR